jgi:transcriptional regulator GlxA family with amidase domain
MTKHIAFLAFPGFQILDVTGPLSAFDIASRYAKGAYTVRVFASSPGAISSSSGACLVAEPYPRRPDFHTVIVSGGNGVLAAAEDKRLLGFVKTAARRAERVASVCSGVAVLATLGLLDGRRATTHWNRSADFAHRFPAVRLEPDRIFVKDGKLWTSAGITAGIDLALAMIAEDLGETIARQTARQLVVYYRRPGGQSQFSALLELDRPGGRFGALLGWAREHLQERLDVERLAERSAMSPRHFARLFARETGMTPARAIERLRVEVAREKVEAGPDSIEGIAARCGFGEPERMRRSFLRVFGQPPQALRRLARA